MSVTIRTFECFPERVAFLAALHLPVPEPPPTADHEHCPGGHHVPGVIGGWHCPCHCHHAAVTP